MSKFDDLEGGELAARLSSAQRMDLIQKGYNPLSPTDVNNYFNKQRPVDGLHEVAGVKERRSLGGGLDVAPDDRGLLGEADQDFGVPRNARDEMQSAMGSYGSSAGSNLDERLLSRMSEPDPRQQPRRPLQEQNSSYNNAVMVTDPAKASKVGYTIGVRYINAFIENIKNPTTENRTLLMKEMSNMNTLESKIHKNVLREYRQGIAQAEKDLHSKLKK